MAEEAPVLQVRGPSPLIASSLALDYIPFMELIVNANTAIRGRLDAIGRTEDLRFSPSGRVLAIAGFEENRILIFGISSGDDGHIALTGGAEIVSPNINKPHGLDFLDEERIIVANREGATEIFCLPPLDESMRRYELLPVATVPNDEVTGVRTPGSVASRRNGDGGYTVFVSNNYINTITRHKLSAGGELVDSELLLRHRLSTPDGIALSADGSWVAVSNHDDHSVFVYALDDDLGPESEPASVLRGTMYPHGLRFTADGQNIIVADAGKPVVNVYPCPERGWRGMHFPTVSHRVMTDEAFRRGNYNPMEGGPKGLDVSPNQSMMAVTCCEQPLSVLLLRPILEKSDLYFSLRSHSGSREKAPRP